jgi:hypothetical protein
VISNFFTAAEKDSNDVTDGFPCPVLTQARAQLLNQSPEGVFPQVCKGVT